MNVIPRVETAAMADKLAGVFITPDRSERYSLIQILAVKLLSEGFAPWMECVNEATRRVDEGCE